MTAPRKLHAPTFSNLQVLAILLEERHVSRAAERLSVTQSSVSKSLATLRHQFNDPLLVRAAGGYELTHKARAIQAKLSSILVGLADLRHDAGDDPAQWQHEFRISMADDVALVLLPQIIHQLKTSAPNVNVTIIGDVENAFSNLHSNKVDLMLDTMPDRGQGLVGESLCAWGWKCVMAPSHTHARKLTYQNYIAADHGLVSFAGDKVGIVDQALGRLNASRNVSLVVPYFSAISGILGVSDTIFTIPAPVEQYLKKHARIASQPLPIDLPDLQISLIWHPRHTQDGAHKWLRQQILDIVQ